jgi:hypothetical protein
VETVAARRLHERVEPEREERLTQEQRDPDDVGERHLRRVEVEEHVVRPVGVIGA